MQPHVLMHFHAESMQFIGAGRSQIRVYWFHQVFVQYATTYGWYGLQIHMVWGGNKIDGAEGDGGDWRTEEMNRMMIVICFFVKQSLFYRFQYKFQQRKKLCVYLCVMYLFIVIEIENQGRCWKVQCLCVFLALCSNFTVDLKKRVVARISTTQRLFQRHLWCCTFFSASRDARTCLYRNAYTRYAVMYAMIFAMSNDKRDKVRNPLIHFWLRVFIIRKM